MRTSLLTNGTSLLPGVITMDRSDRRVRAFLAAVLAGVLTLGGNLQAQGRPPLRPLGPALVTSEALGAIAGVRHLPNGRVLVNDQRRRRVLLMDSTLRVIRVVADTSMATNRAYGASTGGLFAYRGDTSVFVDPASLSMLVIDPEGIVRRVMAAPRAVDMPSLVGGAFAKGSFDAQGRMVYAFPVRNVVIEPPVSGKSPVPPVVPDTAPVVRFDLVTRRLDTLAFTKILAPKYKLVEHEGRPQLSLLVEMFPTVDDWAMQPDGTVAILRGDYHVDFISTGGKKWSSAKIPFSWERLTDSAKAAIIQRSRPPAPKIGDRATADKGTVSVALGVNPGQAPPARNGPDRRTEVPSLTPPPPSFPEPGELPDYRPAFSSGALRSDADGKLWIRTSSETQVAGPEYDVLDRNGKLVDRVAIPRGTAIAGFGAGGIVYLGVRDSAGVHLVRARER